MLPLNLIHSMNLIAFEFGNDLLVTSTGTGLSLRLLVRLLVNQILRLKTDGILFAEHVFFVVCESMIANGDWCNYNATNGICATSQRHH